LFFSFAFRSLPFSSVPSCSVLSVCH
jgi:hypothetical protein